MADNEQLTEQSARHAVYVQRFAGGLDDKFEPYLERLKREISLVVVRTDAQRFRRDAILEQLNEIQRGIYDEYQLELLEDLSEFGLSEAEWQKRALDLITDIDAGLPSTAQLLTSLTTEPLVFPDQNMTKTMESFVSDWTDSEITRVNNSIVTGFITGQTNREILNGVNRILDKNVLRNNQTIVRTGVNHMSSVARQQTLRSNDDIVQGYEWVSRLDYRTSPQCRSLDGEKFFFDDGGFMPMPPIHPNCRSTITPLLNDDIEADRKRSVRPSRGDSGSEDVGAQSTYYGWLKRQTKQFQDLALGPARGKLLRNGKLTSDEFSKLSVDERFNPLTLAEMKAKNPEAFENAGLEI